MPSRIQVLFHKAAEKSIVNRLIKEHASTLLAAVDANRHQRGIGQATFGLGPFPFHPIQESLQHDVFQSSAEAIKVWLATGDIERVGVWTKRPPIHLSPLPEEGKQSAEAEERAKSSSVVATGEQAQSTSATSSHSILVVDRETFSALYQGKTCYLGNTIPFGLLERLNQRPKAFVSYKALINDVWNDEETNSPAVQKQVSILKAKLKNAFGVGIEIRSVPGHYAIFVS